MKPAILNENKMSNAAKIPTNGDKAQKKTNRDTIVKLFGQVKVKTNFFKYAAPILGVSTSTIRINWFHLEVFPEPKQDAIIKALKDYLKQQQ